MILQENTLIYNDSDSIDRNIQQLKYLDYINSHIQLVRKAFDIYFMPYLTAVDLIIANEYFSTEEFLNAIKLLDANIQFHDISKFGDAEFDGYRLHFYPTAAEEAADEDFHKMAEARYEECWNHHRENNKHHPGYWIKNGIATDMELDAIIEMICDWEAVSMKLNGDTLDWYENKANEEKSEMSPKTKAIVEYILYNLVHGIKEPS